MLSNLINDGILKNIAAIVTIVSAVGIILKNFIILTTTSDFDKLFFTKVSRAILNIFDFILGTILIYCVAFIWPSIFIFDFISNLFINLTPNEFSIFKLISGLLWFFLMVPIIYFTKSTKSKKRFRIIKWLIFSHIIFSIPFYSILFKKLIEWNSIEQILLTICIPLLVSAFYVITLFQYRSFNQPKFVITILSDEDLQNRKIIHKYTLDENRTVCSFDDESKVNVFYVFNFSSEVYLKYEKIKKRPHHK
ncbi:hypothetical protein [Bacillus cereus]|uniref:Uncharacterized protein n=1 Tax=Bacillus cereus VD118 TaxID=1053231 RepID=R8Q560_BACCE|nr:hypothetical protein [Bacillus cereus]EOP65877.1 hypothetical protein IIQ_02663 [Bacillus cereus VD118]MCQ6359987.1 hypothetical protein [Bacillus cereus]HDR7609217.1 hypothetical protein [Bacillus mycoides]